MDSKGDSGECCVHVLVSDIHCPEHWWGGDGTDGGEHSEMRHSSSLCNQWPGTWSILVEHKKMKMYNSLFWTLSLIQYFRSESPLVHYSREKHLLPKTNVVCLLDCVKFYFFFLFISKKHSTKRFRNNLQMFKKKERMTFKLFHWWYEWGRAGEPGMEEGRWMGEELGDIRGLRSPVWRRQSSSSLVRLRRFFSLLSFSTFTCRLAFSSESCLTKENPEIQQ